MKSERKYIRFHMFPWNQNYKFTFLNNDKDKNMFALIVHHIEDMYNESSFFTRTFRKQSLINKVEQHLTILCENAHIKFKKIGSDKPVKMGGGTW